LILTFSNAAVLSDTLHCYTPTNCLYPVYTIQPTQTGLTTGLTTALNEQPLFVQPVVKPRYTTCVKPVVKRVWQPVECLYIHDTILDNRTDNRLYRVNGSLHAGNFMSSLSLLSPETLQPVRWRSDAHGSGDVSTAETETIVRRSGSNQWRRHMRLRRPSTSTELNRDKFVIASLSIPLSPSHPPVSPWVLHASRAGTRVHRWAASKAAPNERRLNCERS